MLLNAVTKFFIDYPTDKEEINVCKAIEDLKTEGRAEGRQEQLLASIGNLMDSLNISMDKAMETLKIPADEQPHFSTLLRG